MKTKTTFRRFFPLARRMVPVPRRFHLPVPVKSPEVFHVTVDRMDKTTGPVTLVSAIRRIAPEQVNDLYPQDLHLIHSANGPYYLERMKDENVIAFYHVSRSNREATITFGFYPS